MISSSERDKIRDEVILDLIENLTIEIEIMTNTKMEDGDRDSQTVGVVLRYKGKMFTQSEATT